MGIASRRSVWCPPPESPPNPMTVHAAAAPARRGVHPHRATSPPQLEGERDGEAIARTRRTAQIRSRHAPEVGSGLFSTGPSPPCSSENATGYGSWPHFMSGRAIKVLGRCSMEIIFPGVRMRRADFTMADRRDERTDKEPHAD